MKYFNYSINPQARNVQHSHFHSFTYISHFYYSAIKCIMRISLTRARALWCLDWVYSIPIKLFHEAASVVEANYIKMWALLVDLTLCWCAHHCRLYTKLCRRAIWHCNEKLNFIIRRCKRNSIMENFNFLSLATFLCTFFFSPLFFLL